MTTTFHSNPNGGFLACSVCSWNRRCLRCVGQVLGLKRSTAQALESLVRDKPGWARPLTRVAVDPVTSTEGATSSSEAAAIDAGQGGGAAWADAPFDLDDAWEPASEAAEREERSAVFLALLPSGPARHALLRLVMAALVVRLGYDARARTALQVWMHRASAAADGWWWRCWWWWWWWWCCCCCPRRRPAAPAAPAAK